MARAAKKSERDERQGDLFVSAELFPVRRPLETMRPVDLSLRIKAGLARALRESPDSAEVIATRISEMTGRKLSGDGLYAYTAASKPEQDIGIIVSPRSVRHCIPCPPRPPTGRHGGPPAPLPPHIRENPEPVGSGPSPGKKRACHAAVGASRHAETIKPRREWGQPPS